MSYLLRKSTIQAALERPPLLRPDRKEPPAAPPATCSYCGLPLGGDAAVAPTAPEYCCFGCRFAAQVTQSRGEQGQVNWTLTRLGLAIFLTMNVAVFSMALWTRDLYGVEAEGDGQLPAVLRSLFRYLCLLFALPVFFLLGGPLLENAWESLRRRVATSDLLLLLGVAAAYLYSALSVFRDEGAVYFEVGCAVLVLVTLGRWLEAEGKLKASETMESLHRLLPETARLVRDWDEKTIPLENVRSGDVLHVLPGERIPCDGTILRGRAALDEQVLTGESASVIRETGQVVFSGTLNLDGDLLIESSAPAEGGALARLVELVRLARNSKGHYERLADRLASWFTPAVTALAIVAFALHGWQSGWQQGLQAGLAVLLIACPCALGLATPLAVWTALGRAARAQVLFCQGEALERLAEVRAVRLDKTGTLTTGTTTLAEVAHDDTPVAEVARWAGALAAGSAHSYACEIRRWSEEQRSARASLEVRTLPGRGLLAENGPDGATLCLGNERLMHEQGLQASGTLASTLKRAVKEGQALTCLGWSGAIRAVFLFREQLRPEAAEALAELRQLGLDVAVLTGDHAVRGVHLAHELDVPVEAGLLPSDKVACLQAARERLGPVAMVGDGINDAPALAQADVGIALGCGADVSRSAASVCLLSNDLRRLPWAVAHARRTVRLIRQNLFWALAYNVVGVGLACTGRLNPVVAAAAMVLSSFFVVSNSLRGGADLPAETSSSPVASGSALSS